MKLPIVASLYNNKAINDIKKFTWNGNDYYLLVAHWNEDHVYYSLSTEEICDGIDNNCDGSIDPDCDNDDDGLTNSEEEGLGTDPNNRDTDGDRLSDFLEVNIHNTNPTSADTDGDRLSDGAEINLYGTNPNARDTDGDRLNDFREVRLHHTDPNDSDTDDDGMPDGLEVRFGRDPLDPAG